MATEAGLLSVHSRCLSEAIAKGIHGKAHRRAHGTGCGATMPLLLAGAVTCCRSLHAPAT